MITRITIENFKGVGAQERIELAPLTLLFGANSAGKSTLLHAIHLLREVLASGRLDVHRTELGGDYVELGGFRQFVHKGELDRIVTIGCEVAATAGDFSDFVARTTTYVHSFEVWKAEFDFPSLVKHVKVVGLAIRIGWSHTDERPYISEWIVELNRYEFARLTARPGRPSCHISINPVHPCLKEASELGEVNQIAVSFPCLRGARAEVESGLEALLISCVSDPNSHLSLTENEADDTGDVRYVFELVNVLRQIPRNEVLPFLDGATLVDSDSERNKKFVDNLDEVDLATKWCQEGVSEILLGAGRLVQAKLNNLGYLGPLREMPQREYAPPKLPNGGHWASGLGAWDALYEADEEFLGLISTWLLERLKAGCGIHRKAYFEVDAKDAIALKWLKSRTLDHTNDEGAFPVNAFPQKSRLVVSDAARKLDLAPTDVGVGISQLVPVVVTALHGSGGSIERRRFSTIILEQPELHLHPRLQAELGDLFLESSLGLGKTVIVETHSEHLLLRLLRRVRESNAEDVRKGKRKGKRRRVTPSSLSIQYVEHDGDRTRFKRLEVGPSGDFVGHWPEGFFDERAKELF